MHEIHFHLFQSHPATVIFVTLGSMTATQIALLTFLNLIQYLSSLSIGLYSANLSLFISLWALAGSSEVLAVWVFHKTPQQHYLSLALNKLIFLFSIKSTYSHLANGLHTIDTRLYNRAIVAYACSKKLVLSCPDGSWSVSVLRKPPIYSYHRIQFLSFYF